MASLDVAVGDIDSPTSTGNLTESLSFTPKVILFFGCQKPTFGTDISTEARLFAGAMAGTGATDEGAISISADDGGDTTDGGYDTANGLETVSHSGAANLTANFVSASSNFVVNFSAVEAAAHKITYIALGGSDLSAEVEQITSAASSADIAETGFSFQPECMFFIARKQGRTALTLGAAVGTDSGDEWSIGCRWRSGSTQEKQVAHDLAERCLLMSDDAGAPEDECSFQSFDANGWTVNRDIGTDALEIISIALAGVQFEVGNFTSPTTATTKKITTGFQPELLFIIGSNLTNADARATSAPFGMGAAASTTVRYAHCGVARRNAEEAQTRSENDEIISTVLGDGTAVEEADLTVLESDGFTLDFTTASASALQYAYLAIAGNAAVAGVQSIIPPLQRKPLRHLLAR